MATAHLASSHPNTFGASGRLKSGKQTLDYFQLSALEKKIDGLQLSRLPFSLRILLENLLRR